MKPKTKLCYLFFSSALTLVFSCTNYTGGSHQNPQTRPDITLNYSELITLLQQYDTTKKNQIATAVGLKEDTRINNFKIEDLKAYIRYIEQEAKKKKITVTGINFIAAAYPNDYPDVKKRNYQTLIMMPATTINGEEGVSFDPLKSEKGKPKSLKEILMESRGYLWTYDNLRISNSRSTRSNKSGDDKSSAANRAGITPPF